MRGGKREGAGRKKGSINLKAQEVLRGAINSGITPLEYMLQVLRDPNEHPDKRLDAAKSAAPFCHPRLNSIQNGPDNAPFKACVDIIFRDVK